MESCVIQEHNRQIDKEQEIPNQKLWNKALFKIDKNLLIQDNHSMESAQDWI